MSREYKGERIAIYPSYLDKKLPRRLGRKVPIDVAVENPRIDEIVKVASELGLDPYVEEDKTHPRTWYRYPGRVIVRKADSKIRILKMISQLIKDKYRKKH
ncbi:MAG: signal recognition particle subunit SRP19/SEC65 family protein [Desulfurococcales archaeon]|nr:signal recognition particle subunit SRP19/SEC65 family protein [Desulfurococcales archaeon]